MTMQARLRRWSTWNDGDKGDLRPPIIGDRTNGFAVQCEIDHPASSAGRTVYLRLDEDDLVDLLRVLRDEAVRQRT
jgi:hypothetical protein